MRERGFALVITIALLVLLTMLAVGMLTLSTISLRQGESAMAMATARNNAKMAMFLAIGELQRFAGSDQRATGTANLAGDSGGNAITNGASPANAQSINSTPTGLTMLQAGTRYWTGVWANNDINPTSNVLLNPLNIYTQTPVPKLLQWLVSGNETNQLASSNPTFTPASTVAALNSSGAVGSATQAVVLAGTNTVGSASLNTNHYVSAPLVAIAKSTATGTQPSGRYAWWVGDEGVKAKFNQVAPYQKNATATYPYLPVQRRGWETVTGFAGYPLPGAATSAASVVTLPSAALLNSSFSAQSPTIGASPLQNDFHAATTESYGVIADTLQGGLRLDLSAYLQNGMPSSAPVPNLVNPPISGTNIIPAGTSSSAIAPNILGPKWDALKAFTDLGATVKSGGTMTVKDSTGPASGSISPAIIDLRLLDGVQIVPVPSGSAGQYYVYACGKIAVSLANPYPCPLKWTSPLALELQDSMTPYLTSNLPERVWQLQPATVFLPQSPSESAVYNNVSFIIPPQTLAPGQAMAFTMGAPVLRSVGDTGAVSVSLVPFSGADPSNYSNCLIQQNNRTVTITGSTVQAMDSRESWTTCLLAAHLRLASDALAYWNSTSSNGSYPPACTLPLLRRVEGFELDNSPYLQVQRQVTATIAQQMTHPFPLELYSFQISQPGADYASYLPSGNMGLRSSTQRTFADFNVQATHFRKTIMSYDPPPYFMEINNSSDELPFVTPGGDTGTAFTRNLAANPLKWGRDSLSNSRAVLFSPVPAASLVSLAQFQHADLTADDIYTSVGHQPGNAAGNSYATPYVNRRLSVLQRGDYILMGLPNKSGTITRTTNYYDISYLLNASLWDGFFLSTIPQTGQATPLNPKIVKINPADTSTELQNGGYAAGHLFVDGAFNVNCTEKDAWKALFAGSKYLTHPSDAAGASTDAIFPRSLEQPDTFQTPPSGIGSDSFSGYRRLSDAQIDALATEIVREVRMRGPFVSLSQFVNRALVDIANPTVPNPKRLGRAGALQSAIDNALDSSGGSAINITPDGSKTSFTGITPAVDQLNLRSENQAPMSDMAGGAVNTGYLPTDIWPWDPDSLDLNPGAVASIIADKPMLLDPQSTPEQGFRSTGIPGWLTQADVLQVIGPELTNRSDTFRIRAYGEADDASGKTIAKAWCEAVVQRYPAYLDSTSNKPYDRGASLSTINQTFGRQFKIIAFRWLSPNEI